jgi:acetyltransferase-like isoleucine patch superfamily enzyme
VIGNRRLDQKPVTFYVHDRPFPTDADKMGAVIGDYVRLGANCSTTPGALIGKYSWVYANILVRSFVPKNSLLKLRQAVETVSKEPVVLERLDREGKV